MLRTSSRQSARALSLARMASQKRIAISNRRSWAGGKDAVFGSWLLATVATVATLATDSSGLDGVSTRWLLATLATLATVATDWGGFIAAVAAVAAVAA